MKIAWEWSETRYYVDCPYCGHTQGGEEVGFDDFVACEKCNEQFNVVSHG